MKNILFLILLITIMSYSCGKEELSFDSKTAILGKWELIQQGTSLENLFDVEPRGYTEFLNESSYRFYDYKTKEFDNGDYTLNDSLLIYFYYAVENGQVTDTIPVRYFYTFRNKKTLILDIDALALQDFFIYEKISNY